MRPPQMTPIRRRKPLGFQFSLAAMSTVVAILASPAVVMAEEGTVCVKCSAPDASYACQVDGWQLPPDDARFRLYCISELAKLGKHTSCAAERVTAAPCLGPAKILASPAGGGEPSINLGGGGATVEPTTAAKGEPSQNADPAAQQANDPAGGQVAAQPASNDGTISKAASKAAQSAGDAVGNVGKAIGDTAKKSWNCVTSLFGDC